MKSGKPKLEKWCDTLWKALNTATPADKTAAGLGDLTVAEAYEVQARLLQRKLDRGERIIGWKVGATHPAILDVLKGITDEPVFGSMTSRSLYPNGSGIPASNFCTPALEGEIAFILEKPLAGPGLTPADVALATHGVVGSVELVDSRIVVTDGDFRNIMADNSAHAGILLGPNVRPLVDLDLRLEGVVVSKNGRVLHSACGCEALGNPIHVVTWLANKLAEFDLRLEAGQIVTTGTLGQVTPIEAGDVIDVSYTHLGSIQFYVTE
jgi:2-keto-4-pentenoate hydratase